MESRCGSGETETGGEVKDFNETYREIALNCFRYLDFKSFEEVDRLTIPEYELLMEAVQLKWVDADYRNHLQAFLSFAVQAEKKSGKKSKPVYNKFKKFYDYEEEISKITNKGKKGSDKPRFPGIGKLLKGE